MPVTEVAILPLSPSVDLSDEAFRAKLRKTQRIMANAFGTPSRRRFVYYQGVEDPRSLYLLGEWDSAAEHWDEFLPSPENQEQLALLQDDLDIPSIEMHHVAVPMAQVPIDAAVISIGRHRVRPEDQMAFEESFEACRPWLDGYVRREKKPAGGWRIEKATGKEAEEEWVLLGGWDSVEEHGKFADADGFEKYARIKEFVQGCEVRHGKRIAL